MTDKYIRQDNVILDTATGLEWQAEAVANQMMWDEAMEYAKSLGNDWRMPTIEELATLVDYSRTRPATTFPDHGAGFFWSSSVHADNTSFAWGVAFGYGHVVNAAKFNDYRVRCVRGKLLTLSQTLDNI